jgi:hypothetical protein
LTGIRVTYTGLIAFVFSLAAMFSSVIVTIIITRTLTPEEYGTWGIINSVLIYAVAVEPLIGYWIAREVARKKESGKTGIITSSFLSVGGIGFYLIFAFFVGVESGIDLNIIFLAAILIPLRYVNGTLAAINLSWKPHTLSYALVAQSITQIPLTLFFVYFMEWGITGLIFSVVLAQSVNNLMLAIYTREKIKGIFKKEFIKKWFRLFWISLYPSFATIIFRLDVIIFTLITGSIIGVAFWSASLAISITISHSALISRAIYPKLLEGDGVNYLQKNFTQFFYFSIPLTLLIITFAKPALFVLNPNYDDAYVVLSFLSISIFFTTVGAVIEMMILGNEDVDAFENASFKDFVKSKLFFMPSLEVIQHTIYIGGLIMGFIILMPIFSEMELLFYWASFAMIIRIPFTIYKYKLLKNSIKLELEIKNILKYLIASVIMFVVLYLIHQKYLIYNESIFVFLPNLLVYVGLWVVGYLIITYLMDIKTRILFNTILQEVKKKK